MDCETEISEVVAVLSKFKAGKPLKHYIKYARFPHFKGLERGAALSFTFPFTALVGANGIGKSSVLHALWGMPNKYSTSRFWFSTTIDAIIGSQTDPQRYVYGHFNESFDGVVETRKARVGRKIDYWEPTRWIATDGMQKPPAEHYDRKSKNRWNPVIRRVLYINCKMTLGSFDKYFYLNSDDKYGEKFKESVKSVAVTLKEIITKNKKSLIENGEKKLKENRKLNSEELKYISDILGNKYKSARLIRHSLYPNSIGENLTVIFERGLEYSEAYAGSGEVSIVSAVIQILKAPDYSLILLDEPETSLHPGAQREFLRFLLGQIKTKHHQVVVSTHSRDFLTSLPPDAIKVFEDNGNGLTRIIDGCSANIALHRLGAAQPNKIRILVEDELASEIVLKALEKMHKGECEAFDVQIAAGGAESILNRYGATYIDEKDKIYLFLDGDQKPSKDVPDPDTIPRSEHKKLDNTIKSLFGFVPTFGLNAGNATEKNDREKTDAKLKFLKWCRDRVCYLPRQSPEQILLNALDPKCVNVNQTSNDAKQILWAKLSNGATNMNARDMLGCQRAALGGCGESIEPDLEIIREQLRKWLNSDGLLLKTLQ